jgi:hypothetical protein
MDSKSEGPAATGKGNGEIFGATGAAFGNSGLRTGFGKGIPSVVCGDETKATGRELSRGPGIRPR